VRLRFQIAPGTDSGLGIAGAQFSLLFGGAQFASGQTDANGELGIPIQQLLSGTVVVRIFDTDYNVSLHPGLQSPESLAGQPARFGRSVTGFTEAGAPDLADRGFTIPAQFGLAHGPAAGMAQAVTIRVKVKRDRLESSSQIFPTIDNAAAANIVFPPAGSPLN